MSMKYSGKKDGANPRNLSIQNWVLGLNILMPKAKPVNWTVTDLQPQTQISLRSR